MLRYITQLSICFDNCVANGSVMKELVREKKIKEEDIVHFLVLMDELRILRSMLIKQPGSMK